MRLDIATDLFLSDTSLPPRPTSRKDTNDRNEQIEKRLHLSELAKEFPQYELSFTGEYIDYGGSEQKRIVINVMLSEILNTDKATSEFESFLKTFYNKVSEISSRIHFVLFDQRSDSGFSSFYQLHFEIERAEEISGLLNNWADLLKIKDINKSKYNWFLRKDNEWWASQPPQPPILVKDIK